MCVTGDLETVLRRENDSHSSADRDSTASIISEVSALSHPGSVESAATSKSLQEACTKVSESLLSSQELVCGRLREIVVKKKRLVVIS